MYYRLYASKNNTIFQQFTPNTFSPLTWSQNVNTGNSPVLQLMDGSAESKVLFGFNLPTWLKEKITNSYFTCNLKIYDAGAQYDSLLPMKEIKLEYFNADFSEGDGWFYNELNSSSGISNWLNNLDGNLWSSISFTSPIVYNLNKNNEDLLFDVSSIISSSIISSNNYNNFALSVNTPQTDINILTKFLWGRHTKTMFQPYLEFFIQDDILDDSYNFTAGQTNNIYFINENNINFTDTVTAIVLLNDNTSSTLTATILGNGKYFISITPIEPNSFTKKEYVTITWKIGSKNVYKQILEVIPQNLFIQKTNLRNLMFYPVTPYSNNIIRQGDIIPFEVISQIRGMGDIISNTFEYRIVNAAGFEMTPWTPVSVYKNKMFFYIRTDFFYPEMMYEVFIQNKTDDFQITSNTSYKFKLTSNEASHLRELSATPYYNKDNFFGK